MQNQYIPLNIPAYSQGYFNNYLYPSNSNATSMDNSYYQYQPGSVYFTSYGAYFQPDGSDEGHYLNSYNTYTQPGSQYRTVYMRAPPTQRNVAGNAYHGANYGRNILRNLRNSYNYNYPTFQNPQDYVGVRVPEQNVAENTNNGDGNVPQNSGNNNGGPASQIPTGQVNNDDNNPQNSEENISGPSREATRSKIDLKLFPLL